MGTNFSQYITLDKSIKNYRNDLCKLIYTVMTIICLVFISETKVHAQFTQIRVTTTVLPPYSPYLSDYLEFRDKLIVVLNNTSGSPKNVKLGARLTSDGGFIAETDPDFQPGIPYVVQPSVPYDLLANGDGFEFFNAQNINISYEDLTIDDLLADGILPEGRYTLCITAYDYDTGVPLSMPTAGNGCTSFVIDYKNAPRLITPVCGDSTKVSKWTPQNIPFMWTRVVAGIGISDVVYDLYIVPLMEGTEPQDEVMSAVSGNNINAITINNLTQTNYTLGIADIVLEEGNYAWVVKARDVLGNYPIENNGLSQICTFKYKNMSVSPVNSDGKLVETPNINRIDDNDATCSCLAQVAADGASYESSLNNKEVEIGEFTMEAINASLNPDGSFRGTGMIKMPVLNVAGLLKLKVSFDKIFVKSIGDKLFVASGIVGGIKKAGASLMPSANNPELGIPTISPSEAQDIVDKTKNQFISTIENTAKSIGFELPLGLDNIGPLGTVAITDIIFTERQASFNAAVIIDIPETNTPLALGAKNICFSKEKAICGEGTFYLGADYEVNFTDFVLKATKGFGNGVDSGTYVTFKENDIKRMRLRMDYKMPQSIRRASDGGTVTAKFAATAASWNDWFAEGSIEDFKVGEGNDFVFKMGNGQSIIFDHSDLRNANNPFFSKPFTSGDPNVQEQIDVQAKTWRGLYIPSLGVQLPGILNNNNQPIAVGVKDVVITLGSSGGMCAQIVAGTLANGNPLLSIGDGNLSGWYYSIDNLSLNIWKSSFKSTSLIGKVVLPISGSSNEEITNPNNQIDYTCTLSFPAGQKTQFQFIIQRKENLIVPIWAAKFTLLNTSTIIVENSNASGNSFLAKATLNGMMNINTNGIPAFKDLPTISFNIINFEGLQIMSVAPYIKVDKFNAGFASPQKILGTTDDDFGSPGSTGGFPISITDIKFGLKTFNGSLGGAGITFLLKVQVADIPSLPMADFGFGLYASIKMVNSHFKWGIEPPEINRLALKGSLGPIAIDGFVDFVNGDDVYGDCIRGKLKAEIISAVKVDVELVLGSKSNFKYFYISALASIESGIPIPPCLALYGIGGGFYYNMLPPPTPTVEDILNGKTIGNKGSAGYVPYDGSFGFRFSVVMGLTSKELLHFKGDYEMSFRTRAGLEVDKVQITGAIYMMTSGMVDKEKAMIYGEILIRYDFPQSTFYLEATVKAKFPIIQVDGTVQMLIGPEEWFISVGTPNSPCVASIEIFNFIRASLSAYFMMGNVGVYLPDPPIEVMSKFPEFRPRSTKISTSGMKLGRAGFALGAAFRLDVNGNFGPLYVKINSLVGFDVSVLKYEEKCVNLNPQHPPGLDGWYGKGNAYGYLSVEGGLDIGITTISLVELGIAALVQFAAPNPIFIRGGLDIRTKFLGIVIKAKITAQFGTPCTLGTDEWPFGSIPIISDVKPESDGQSILARPVIAFNLPVETDFDFVQETENDDGSTTYINRRFNIKLKTEIRDIDKNKPFGVPSFYKFQENNSVCIMDRSTAFEPLTNYDLKVTVEPKEYKNNTWVPCKSKGVNVIQTEIRTFKTKECIKKLNEENENAVCFSYPSPGQRYFLPEEDKNGYIKLSMNVPCLVSKYDLYIRYEETACDGSGYIDVPVRAGEHFNGAGNFNLSYTIPSTLKPEKYYQVSVVGKPKFIMAQRLTRVSVKNTYAKTMESEMKIDYNEKKLANEADDINSYEEILYSYVIRTSKYKTLTEKLSSYSTTAKGKRYQYGLESNYMMEWSGGERFDTYDINGESMWFVNKNYHVMPMITLAGNNQNSWSENFGNQMYLDRVTAVFGTFHTSLRDVLHHNQMRNASQMKITGGLPPRGPIRMDYDPLLIGKEGKKVNCNIITSIMTTNQSVKYSK